MMCLNSAAAMSDTLVINSRRMSDTKKVLRRRYCPKSKWRYSSQEILLSCTETVEIKRVEENPLPISRNEIIRFRDMGLK